MKIMTPATEKRKYAYLDCELINLETGKITFLTAEAVEYLDNIIRFYCHEETWLFNHRLNNAGVELERSNGVKK